LWPERRCELVDVLRHGLFVVTPRRALRAADAAEIGCYYGVYRRQPWNERHPHVTGLGIAVKQQNQGPASPDLVTELDAIGGRGPSTVCGSGAPALGYLFPRVNGRHFPARAPGRGGWRGATPASDGRVSRQPVARRR